MNAISVDGPAEIVLGIFDKTQTDDWSVDDDSCNAMPGLIVHNSK